MKTPSVSRREFLQLSAGSLGACGAASPAAQQRGEKALSVVIDPAFSSSAPVMLAVQELGGALAERGFALRQAPSVEQAAAFCILAAAPNLPLASATLQRAAAQIPRKAESLAIVASAFNGRPGVLACGSDARGLTYAIHELADRVRHTPDPLIALQPSKPVEEEPFSEVRGVGRLFVSEVEDRPWFEDRAFWPPYLSMLAAQRFNRLHLALGIGYDSLEGVTDAYMLFAYPFLLSTPGYSVRAVNLADDIRERNLQLLQFISSEAVAHGLDFQLGIWTHGYQWPHSPQATYTIEGLTPETHAAYCRDSLATLLRSCPAISGVTLRTHGESGVREGSYAFWRTVFEGAAQCGRKVEIDLHTKGLDQEMIEGARATGLPVRLSPKYWAEHVGMPYQQAAIRELEQPPARLDAPRNLQTPPEHEQAFFALSTGTRSFTRYGYADFLRESRRYSVMFRVWPGTHRMLLSGDPRTTAAHAHALRFCGSAGAEIFEPLSFKGRRGSGIPGGRCAYADESLNPAQDWQKFEYTYRLWGRLLYNPETDPDTWRRFLRKRFHTAAPFVEAALGNASRILPLVTTAHLPSAANDTYVPELYTNQPIADESAHHPYGDTPSPKVFSNVSPLDPQMFCGCSAYVEELTAQKRSGRHSPIEVARWLDELAAAATHHLALATHGGPAGSAELRRVAIDVQIQAGLGRFFAAKLRSGVLYALYARCGSRSALEQSLQEYRRARAFWAQVAHGAGKVYLSDITIGPLPHQRGHWLDRLPAMDADIEAMARQLVAGGQRPGSIAGGQRPGSIAAGQRPDSIAAGQPPGSIAADPAAGPATGPRLSAIATVLADRSPVTSAIRHVPPEHFAAGAPLDVALSVPQELHPNAVLLHYRHVDQAEDYQVAQLQEHAGEYRASIPGSYTASSYPLQYFFELQLQGSHTELYPGFGPERTRQPYFVVRLTEPRGAA